MIEIVFVVSLRLFVFGRVWSDSQDEEKGTVVSCVSRRKGKVGTAKQYIIKLRHTRGDDTERWMTSTKQNNKVTYCRINEPTGVGDINHTK